MNVDRIAEYITLAQNQDVRGREFILAAWEFGRAVIDYGDTAPEVAVHIGRTKEWVENRIELARQGKAELERLMDEKGINSLARIRMELIRAGKIPPTGTNRDYPKIRYMPPILVQTLTEKGYSANALRNLMHRVGFALQEQVVTTILDSSADEGSFEITLRV